MLIDFSNVPHGESRHTVTRNKHIKLYSENRFLFSTGGSATRCFVSPVCLDSPWGTIFYLPEPVLLLTEGTDSLSTYGESYELQGNSDCERRSGGAYTGRAQ